MQNVFFHRNIFLKYDRTLLYDPPHIFLQIPSNTHTSFQIFDRKYWNILSYKLCGINHFQTGKENTKNSALKNMYGGKTFEEVLKYIFVY